MMSNGNCFVKNLPEGLDVFYDETLYYGIYHPVVFKNKKGESLIHSEPPCFFDSWDGITPLLFSKKGAVRMMRLKQDDALTDAEKIHEYDRFTCGGHGVDSRFEYGVLKWNGKGFDTVVQFGEYESIQPINPDGYALVMRMDFGGKKIFPDNIEYGVANFDEGLKFTIEIGKHPHLLCVTDKNMVCFSDIKNRQSGSAHYGVLDVNNNIVMKPIMGQAEANLFARGKSNSGRSLDQAAIDKLIEEHNQVYIYSESRG